MSNTARADLTSEPVTQEKNLKLVGAQWTPEAAILNVFGAMAGIRSFDEAVDATANAIRKAFTWSYAAWLPAPDEAGLGAREHGERPNSWNAERAQHGNFSEPAFTTEGASLPLWCQRKLIGTMHFVFGQEVANPRPSDCLRELFPIVARLLEEMWLRDRERKDQRGIAEEFESNVGAMVEIIGGAASEMKLNSHNLVAGSEQTSRQARTAAEDMSKSVSSAASAAEQLSTSIKEISLRVQESANMVRRTSSDVDAANAMMGTLNEASREISQVIKVITSIAQQTNLLALNATIEAARAGEAGRGFAVVANEVKELARQTAKATEEIERKIVNVQKSTDLAVGSINSISGVMAKLSEISIAIAAAIEEQTAATGEIADSVAKAAKRTTEVSDTIGGVLKIATDSGRRAKDIEAASLELIRQASKLQEDVCQFLERVRGA